MTVRVASSRLPLVGHIPHLLVRRDAFLQSVRGRGGVVKIYLGRKPCYVLNSPSVVHRALVCEASSLDKGLIFDRARPFFGNGLVTSSGEFHRRQRRIMQPAFHRARIEEYAATIARTVDRLVSSWEENEILCLDKELRKLTSRAITDSLFAGSGMQDQEIRDEIMSILVAGIGTLATSLSWACQVLARRPDITERIRAEARSMSWHPGQSATAADFPFTDRFIMEVQRLYQPNWIMMRRTREAVDLGTTTISSGCELIYSAATLHRDPELYPDPLTFDPDRWIGWIEDRQRCTFVPFGAGNRKCIGDTYAWSLMLLVILTITTKWTLHADPRHKVRRVVTAQIHPDSLPMRVVRLDHQPAAAATAGKGR